VICHRCCSWTKTRERVSQMDSCKGINRSGETRDSRRPFVYKQCGGIGMRGSAAISRGFIHLVGWTLQFPLVVEDAVRVAVVLYAHHV
jgi:hypothetical protein